MSVPRLIAVTNMWLGFSHTSKAKDRFIKETMGRKQIADILEVFCLAGVDAVYGGRPDATHLAEAIADAQDRTGRRITQITVPTLNVAETAEAQDENARTLDAYAAIGTNICMPHQGTTDKLTDRRSRTIRGAEKICAMIRRRGMVPGLSTHLPEVPIYADESGLDVETYIQIYNAAGFLMPIEVDWVHRMIWKRAKPVITIKPLAAGRLEPLVGLAFAWATLREIDCVTAGTQTPDEARELIEISLALLERRAPEHELQTTRSKASL